jgi:hypothetical protein
VNSGNCEEYRKCIQYCRLGNNTFSPGGVLALCSLSLQLSQRSTSTSPILVHLLKISIGGIGFRFVPIDCSFSDSISSSFQACKCYGRLLQANSCATNSFDLGLIALVCFIAADFQASDTAHFNCLSRTTPGYSINVVTAIGWCFVHPKQHGKTQAEC